LLSDRVPVRVIADYGADYIVEDGTSQWRAAAKGCDPAVGDWVTLDGGFIAEVLSRRTVFSRRAAGVETREQVLAANVDVAFLVQALPLDFNPRRLERYLAMAWESGGQPVVVLTKTDLVADVEPFLAEAEAVTLGACPIVAVSALTGDHLGDLLSFFDENRTAVLLGSSGVGKSTIVNALVGEQLIETQEVRADDQRGRHTTTRRQLVVLPSGGVVLDTPGIRELQLWDADLEQTFGDVEEIARRCRFSDCAHDREPGCAVREALLDGTLARERWDSYVKLQRELEALEARRNHLLRQERVREYKIRERANRRKKRH
jgi:ribosome biogenesis GTPase / thiamine phosphate phosphatase